MFFEDVLDIEKIAQKTGTSVFVVPDPEKIVIKNALILKPEEKSTITIDQVREVLNFLTVKAKTSRYIIISPAEKLGEEAANALLKNLEEPKENYHFVLVTANPSGLMQTILSRSAIYFLKTKPDFSEPPKADEKTKTLARELIAASANDLINLADKISKLKDNPRERALEILSTGVEILYKSFLKTNNIAFLKKIPSFLTAYENISKNGHIKLHLVADMI